MLLIVLAPQLMGGTFAWCVPVIAAAALVCLGLTLPLSGLRRSQAPRVLWVALSVTGWTALQLLPLGTRLISKISPERTTPLHLVQQALGHELAASATAITLDPTSTQLELIKGCSLCCTFFVCYVLAGRGHERLLFSAAATSGVLMALVALAHRALDAQSVFGIYKWKLVSPQLPAPILNDNCLAGFMVLTTPVSLGLAFSSRDARFRFLLFSGAFVVATVGLLTGSRGGTAAMVFALICMMLVSTMRGRVSRERWQQTAIAVVVVAAAIGVAVVVGAEPLLQTLRAPDYSKIEFIRQSFVRSMDAAWVGVGRGAFSVAMAHTMSDAGRFVHAENFIATWAIEWGIPIACAVLATLTRSITRLWAARSSIGVGTGVGLVAFGAQNLFDLGIELLGIATVAAALLGTALGAQDGEPAPPRFAYFNLRNVGAALGVVSLAVLAMLSSPVIRNGDDANLHRLERHRADRAHASFRRELKSAVDAHPLEPVLFMTAAREAADRLDPVALRWLNLVMLRSPQWSVSHAEASRFLVAIRRPSQAALEARETARLNPELGAHMACRVAAIAPSADLVMVAAAGALANQRPQKFFDQVIRCLNADTAREVDRRLLEQGAPITGPALREYGRLAVEGNAAGGLQLLKQESQTAKPTETVLLAYIHALISVRDLDAAERQIERGRRLGFSKEGLARLVAELETRKGNVARMRAAIDDLRALSAASGEKLASAATLLGKLEERLGNVLAAEEALDDAAALDPSPATLKNLLSFVTRHGNTAKALRVKSSLCAVSGSEADCSQTPHR